MSDYHLTKRVPSVEDYNRVRVAAGLSEKDDEAVRVGLANTIFRYSAFAWKTVARWWA